MNTQTKITWLKGGNNRTGAKRWIANLGRFEVTKIEGGPRKYALTGECIEGALYFSSPVKASEVAQELYNEQEAIKAATVGLRDLGAVGTTIGE
jgi:hypothetical protein